MRKSTILFLPVLAMMVASCSDEKDDIVDYAAKVKGAYDGYVVASCAYFDGQISTEQKVTVSTVTVDKVKVDYVSDTWGSISVPAASVSETGGAYVINGTGTSEMTHNGNTKTYECNLSGKIVGGDAEFTFACPAVMGGLTLTFRTGERADV